MRPTAKEMSSWYSKITKNPYAKNRDFNELDIEALDEAFRIFLNIKGDNEITINTKSFPDDKEFKKQFYNKCKTGSYENFEEWKDWRENEHSFRERVVGYSCKKNFRVQSLKPKFKNYTFDIWHDISNTQIMIDKGNDMQYIRIMWDSLFLAIYEFYSKKKPQTNLFGEVV